MSSSKQRSTVPSMTVARALADKSFPARVFLVAVGKAAYRMAAAALDVLPVPVADGVVISKYGHLGEPLPGLRFFEAGHPVPDDNSVIAAEAAQAVTLPHTWNAIDGQDGGNDYWRGAARYSKSFPKPELKEHERLFIEFKGAAMSADVILNGRLLCHHEGGYSCFRADMTDALEAENLLVVSVDNGGNDRVYPQKADFTFYGGLYRDVNLIAVPEEHFELLKDGTPGIKVTPTVDLETKTAAVTVETRDNAASVAITVNGETKTVERSAEFVIENARLWDGVDDPYLYTATPSPSIPACWWTTTAGSIAMSALPRRVSSKR